MSRTSAIAEAVLEGRPLPLKVIDIHAHIGSYSAFHIPRPDAAAMVEVMDRVGVAATAASASGAWAADMRTGNDLVAEAVRAYPDRFIGYGVINPNYPDDIDAELNRIRDVLGFRMIKVHPAVHQRVITDPAYEPVFAFAGETSMPVLTHTWVGDPHCSPQLCAEAAERFPSVTFIWGHSGGSDQKAALELAPRLPNVCLEMACSQVFYGQLEHMLNRFPAERILYGSDFCFISLPQQLAKVALADVSDEVKSLILRGNSVRILEAAGIPAP